MPIHSLRMQSYPSFPVNDTLDPEATERLQRLERYQELRNEGCSEFRAEFEQACEELNLPLFVLPPRCPQLNGCVERANDTTRVEFWNQYDGAFTASASNRALTDYRHCYHHVRPHQGLDMRTPSEYLLQQQGQPLQSHMY